MPDERIMRAIVDKCDFYYGDSLLSKETIIEKYLRFFAEQFDPSERSVCFAFHTGSLCFDVVSVAALMIGCLAYEFSSNDEILAQLEPGDMVLYKGERYRWCGIEMISPIRGVPSSEYIILSQDAKGKNGSSQLSLPYSRNKHLIKPYLGTSVVTDGRGIRKDKTNRTDFISSVLEIPVQDVPTALDLSVVVVADKNVFIEICKHLIIEYGQDKAVSLTDGVPVSYFTGSGEQFQIGKNASKAEPVIKVTSKISTARDLILDRQGNRVIGLLVFNVDSLSSNSAELNDLLRRKSLKFAYVLAPFSAESCEIAIEQYDSAKLFACTKALISESDRNVNSVNKLTNELHRQISNIIGRKTSVISVDGYWDWERYRKLKEKVFLIKQANWTGEDRDNFILSSIALINLFTTSFFSMAFMESAITAGRINLAVVSPEARIAELMNISTRVMNMHDQCVEVATILLDMYSALHDCSPKEVAFVKYLEEHRDERIAFIVPKAYYSDLFSLAFGDEFPNVTCVTANRFDIHTEFDRIIATGDVVGKKFDALQCFSAPDITLFLYSYEEKTFSFRKRKTAKSERKLNARIKGLKGEEYYNAVETDDSNDPGISEKTIQEFSDLDAFVESMGLFDIRRITAYSSGNAEYGNNTSEVKFIGRFTTGEQILFSRYYSAVVFNQSEGVVTETKPENLLPGDILVFTKKDGYTSNIVDQIFDQLISTRKLSPEVMDAAEKAFYWKAALREYKERNQMTYRAVAKELKKHGSSLQEVTVRQWLIEESHIVGPRDAKTMSIIAKVTQDPYLLSDPSGYYEGCRIVRHYRREILSLIARAINDKLSNKHPTYGSAFEVVYENVENLSETLELENVFELDEAAFVNNGMVNRPISESEVLM